jgi:hypothetical protein
MGWDGNLLDEVVRKRTDAVPSEWLAADVLG